MGTKPRRSVIEVSLMSIIETPGNSHWHELCHVVLIALVIPKPPMQTCIEAVVELPGHGSD